MSVPTVAVVANDVEHLTRRVETIEADVKFLLRALFWGSGVCFGFGAVAALIIPKLATVLGLG